MNLSRVLEEITSCLNKGVADKNSQFRYFVLSTVCKNNKPNSRIVIIRDFENYKLTFYSSYNSKKIGELNKNKNVNLVFYDEINKIQLRVKGTAIVKRKVKKIWDSLNQWSKREYINNTTKNNCKDKSSFNIDEGYKNFCCVIIKIQEIEWLCLSRNGHKRAKFNFKKKDVIKKWLEP